MKNRVTAQNFCNLFLKDTPFLDVRAEDEYARGSFPHATNIPVLNNHERRLVGIRYKQAGQQAAVRLGHELVGGELKAVRLKSWQEFITTRPNTHIYCWRGGMRSKIAQQWLYETGVNVPLIEGGYKAMRRFLIEKIDEIAKKVPMIRIGGKTGVAKSQLIRQIAGGIDLEKHAHHRGSSFGSLLHKQPTQINFEHTLAIDLMRSFLLTCHARPLFVEDESRNIGTVYIPLSFFNAMRRSKLVLVDMPMEFRVQHILQEYVIDMLAGFNTEYGEDGFERLRCYLTESLWRIQKRLGLERYKIAAELMTKALQAHKNSGDVQQHEAWIFLLLTEYYDPMYQYQIEKKQDLVVFRGDYATVLDWVKHHGNRIKTVNDCWGI